MESLAFDSWNPKNKSLNHMHQLVLLGRYLAELGEERPGGMKALSPGMICRDKLQSF